MASISAGPTGFTPDLTLQAQRLVAYLRDRHPQLTDAVATMVAIRLAAQPDEDVKLLARRLADSLLQHGIKIKHTHAIEAASQMVYGRPWLSVRTSEPPHRLKILPVLKGFDETTLPDWRAAGEMLVKICDAWLSTSPETRWFRAKVNEVAFMLVAPVDGADLGIKEFPIAAINALGEQKNWLTGAADAMEYLRRHLEEPRRALLDGVAALELCSRTLGAAYEHPFDPKPDDAMNSELVLRREDNPAAPYDGYEVVRGDEMTCWNQFVYAIRQEGDQDISVDEDGAWCYGNARFTWLLQTLRPHEFVPGLSHRQISDWESNRLLHRYVLAQQIFKGALPRVGGKKLEILSQPAESYAVEPHQVLLALSKAGYTWETYSAKHLEKAEEKLGATLPLGTIYMIATMLDLPDPDKLFARPQRADLVRADDDRYLQALMPRVDHVRYRIDTSVSTQEREAVNEAIADFSAALMMRKGVVQTGEDFPDLVYSDDCSMLLGKFEELGLVAHVGVRPHLTKIPDQPNGAPPVGKYAFGHSLYLAIDRA